MPTKYATLLMDRLGLQMVQALGIPLYKLQREAALPQLSCQS